jgi:hypothetical protein
MFNHGKVIHGIGKYFRTRRCQNCKHFITGMQEYAAYVKEKGLKPLEDYPTLVANGIAINPGSIDKAIAELADGKVGRCKVYKCKEEGDEKGMLISGAFLCDDWSGLPGLREEFAGQEDLTAAEIRQAREEGEV